MTLPLQNQTDSQFVANYLWPALVANDFNEPRARFALAQAAKESGNVSSNSVAGKTNNFLAITAGSRWQGDVYRSQSSGLLFRAYPNALESFKDHRRLIEESYPSVWAAPTVEDKAKAVAQSAYITESVGDNRQEYERGILSKYYAQEQYVDRLLTTYKIAAIGGVVVVGGIAMWFALKPKGAIKLTGDTTKDVYNFFKFTY